MLILLSPSKTQDFINPTPFADYTQPALLEESKLLMKELKKFSEEEISGLMHISGKLATLNYERYQHFKTPFTPANSKQAVFAFQGDVYDGLNVTALGEDALYFLQEHVRILSGLYGALRPLDLIQAYRLEMGTSLKNIRGRDLYAFWGDKITDSINTQLQAINSDIVINLASEEYFKAINVKKLNARLITPQFKEKRLSGYKMIGLFAKKARGHMAHYIAHRQIEEPEALRFFAEDGYRLNVTLSTAKSPVYTRG
jgi:cytoplasmic iron level regulating protein YaaA (DUF328/UPF0246 family)